MADRFDAVVIGAGPAGEVAASRLAHQKLRVALAERELIGGECGYWACIPSKTMLRPPEARHEAKRAAGLTEPDQRWPDVVEYRDFMVRHLDDSRQVTGYERSGVTVFKQAARIAGPGRIRVGEETIETERIVVATGSEPVVPPIEGLADIGYWTNREVYTLSELPDSVVVLGGGPVGIETSQMLRRFGVEVVLVQAADRLLNREGRAPGEQIAAVLRDEGVDVRLGRRAVRVGGDGSGRTVELDDGDKVSGQELVIATGRRPRTDDLGLETVGIDAGGGGIRVDSRCRAADGVWAIGDVTGVMPFTHVGMYQARIVADDIAGREVAADYSAIPRVVFCDPEIAAVGLTEQQARERNIDLATSTVSLPDAIARPWTYERDPRGTLGLLADRGRGVLVGAWAIAPQVGEWIHYAALAIKTQTPLSVLRDTVAQFPTYTEAYLKAVEALDV
jgi:pyruvate/2-oxoglutarate dehydrogenase complex dihydrolipoamide dehydrogenase (E3) component